jgi:hypothetical protein
LIFVIVKGGEKKSLTVTIGLPHINILILLPPFPSTYSKNNYKINRGKLVKGLKS